MEREKSYDSLLTAIENDRAELIDLCLRLGNTASPHGKERAGGIWRDLNVFNEVGIPSNCYGPPRQKETMSGAQNRAMKISDLIAATKVYALTTLRVCEVAEI